MQISDFDFFLPQELIAQFPPKNRTDSRLLVLEKDKILDKTFKNFLDFIKPNDIIVRNNTKVIKARIFGNKKTGGKVEILVERILSDNQILALAKSNKNLTANTEIIIQDAVLKVLQKKHQFYKLELSSDLNADQLLEKYGSIPLPPYIKRNQRNQQNENDLKRYQTVYSEVKGAVAAPTAGLHFDDEILKKIKAENIKIEDITLHVGSGTFQPIRVENISDHKMHSEIMQISPEVCQKINQTKQSGGRVIAIGTTTLRALESSSLTGKLVANQNQTDIFITPGFKFNCVDVLLTNFHLPKSTLLMLISAFAGTGNIKLAYQHAIQQKYRFFSYGDACLLFNNQE